MDITDTQLQAAQLLGEDAARGPARRAADRTGEGVGRGGLPPDAGLPPPGQGGRAFTAGFPGVTARLHTDDPELYPGALWADWLCGDHPAVHRQRVLAEFAAGGTDAARRYLGSVKVLGEGVDIQNCDSVYFADVRGSMPDLVQAVGRALRVQPGEGKVASLVVPILLGPGETTDNMLTSKAYDGLAKLLEALRAHDTRIGRTAGAKPLPGRPEPHRGPGRRERRERGGRPYLGAGAGAAEVQHPARCGRPRHVHQPPRPQPSWWVEAWHRPEGASSAGLYAAPTPAAPGTARRIPRGGAG
ncbi:helicase-related protein [Streptomyces sp. NPDC004232]|uniref:helicase-related protein n=1 Tax=Streptomyces sp. NPDC004232 TaxID=3154454 RepID=UPI0033A2E7E2